MFEKSWGKICFIFFVNELIKCRYRKMLENLIRFIRKGICFNWHIYHITHITYSAISNSYLLKTRCAV